MHTNTDTQTIKLLEKELGIKLKKFRSTGVYLNKPGYYENEGNVTFLSLINISLESIPETILDLSHLLEIRLRKNKLTDANKLSNLKNLTKIDISLNQITDIDFISNLPKLNEIDASENKISKFNLVNEMPRLKKLHLSYNQLNSIRNIKKLKFIEVISISNNQFNSLNDFNHLLELKYLNAGANRLTNTDNLRDCTKLNHLDLNDNKITNCSFIENLIYLDYIDLSNNNLSYFPNLNVENRLKSLSLENNKIVNISFLNPLKKLNSIWLNDNLIEDISHLSSLSKLQFVLLANNQIENIDPITSLKKLRLVSLEFNNIKEINKPFTSRSLRYLRLTGNQIKLFPKWILNSSLEIQQKNETFYGLTISKNPIENIPFEIIHLGKEAIKDYFTSLDEGSFPINEIKVIFLGEGAAGKTSLMKYLKGELFDPVRSQTHGINIEEFADETGVNMKLWDFGGQDIMHHTHQLFLTQKSIYILVLNARENSDTEKWLKMIQVFGGDSPIIIVTNKIDENPSSHENIRFLNEKYPTLNNRYIQLSCSTGVGLDKFKFILSQTVKDLLHVRTLWGSNWLKVKNELELLRNGEILKDYIHFEKYLEICDKYNVPLSHRDTLINWLNRLGVITYFPDSALNETNVINPSWLTEAFYKIINSHLVAKKQGRFSDIDLARILDNKRYPNHKYSYLMNLMCKFELCYTISTGEYLIPDLLSKVEPNFKFEIPQSLKLKFQYKNYLPKAIFPKFIVRENHEIKDDLKWRTGLILQNDYLKSEALVRVDEEEKEISVFVNGEEKRAYISIIISNIEQINNIYQGLEYDLLIPCSCKICSTNDKPFHFKYKVLQNHKNKNRSHVLCDISSEDIFINDLLGGVFTKEELENKIDEFVGTGTSKIKKYIENGNIYGFIEVVKALLSSVSYLLLEKSEKAYHTPLFILLRAIFSSRTRADEIQVKGRTDIVIEVSKFIYILELKLDGTSKEAIKQIYDKKYFEPYILEKKKIMLIGINFSSIERNIESFEFEEYQINLND